MQYSAKFSISDFPARTWDGEFVFFADRQPLTDDTHLISIIAKRYGVNTKVVRILSVNETKVETY